MSTCVKGENVSYFAYGTCKSIFSEINNLTIMSFYMNLCKNTNVIQESHERLFHNELLIL